MVNKIFNIPLDMKRPSSSYNDLEVVEGDSGNILVITLTDDGEVVDLTGCRVLAVFSRADGKTVEQDTDGNGITVGGDAHNEITIDLYQDSFRPGSVSCEIQVYSGTDTLVTSARFTFSCRPSIMNDTTIAATDEYPILVKLINDTEQACADAVEAVETANTAAASATGAATAANTAADAASAAAIDASDAASAAGMQAGRAETAAIAAEGATDRANAAAERAEQAVTNPADMTKTVYDTNNSGVVDNAERLGGKLPGDYAAAKHAAQHASNGSDAITPGSIGAEKARLERTATLQASAWVSNAQTIPVSGVTVSSLVVVSAAPASHVAYGEAGVYCSVQAEGSLTFRCSDVPTEDLSVNVVIWR